MCFTKYQSLGIFILGVVVAFYLKQIQQTNSYLWIPILYFAFMELLQYIGYETIENKKKYLNKVVATVIYIHIGFQPFFINMWYSNFIPKSQLTQLFFVLKLCFVFGLFWISRLIFWDNSYKYLCDSLNEPGCGKFTEVLKGPKHLLYKAKVRAANYLTPSIFSHFFLWFIPVLFLNVNKMVYFIILMSGLSGWLLASNIHEAASIWCFLFIPIMIISLIYKYLF